MSAAAAAIVARSRPRLLPEVASETLEDGGMLLHGPAFRRGPIRSFLARAFRLPDRLKVQIDSMGAFVVARLDGRTMAELAGELADHLRLTARESEAVLSQFIRLLVRRRLVVIDGLEGLKDA